MGYGTAYGAGITIGAKAGQGQQQQQQPQPEGADVDIPFMELRSQEMEAKLHQNEELVANLREENEELKLELEKKSIGCDGHSPNTELARQEVDTNCQEECFPGEYGEYTIVVHCWGTP